MCVPCTEWIVGNGDKHYTCVDSPDSMSQENIEDGVPHIYSSLILALGLETNPGPQQYPLTLFELSL